MLSTCQEGSRNALKDETLWKRWYLMLWDGNGLFIHNVVQAGAHEESWKEGNELMLLMFERPSGFHPGRSSWLFYKHRPSVSGSVFKMCVVYALVSAQWSVNAALGYFGNNKRA